MQDMHAMLAGASPCTQVSSPGQPLHLSQEPGSFVAGFFPLRRNPPYSSKGGVTDRRVRERFHARRPRLPQCRNKHRGVLALNLSRALRFHQNYFERFGAGVFGLQCFGIEPCGDAGGSAALVGSSVRE